MRPCSMLFYIGTYLILLCCSHKMEKINFDISQLDENGLIGNQLSKVSLAYEFCIPKNKQTLNEINNIDSNIKILKCPGRSRCSNNQYLCVGETNQDYKQVLGKISSLPYVTEINRCYYE